MADDHRKPIDLNDAVSHILEECRMVLPGVQALFGFQLIAVIEDGFQRKLTGTEQVMHLVAIGLVGLSIALLMAPAAYHRQVEPEEVSRPLLRIASWMLTLGMVPLMLALVIELYIIARIILDNRLAASLIAAALFVVLASLWFLFPLIRRMQRNG